MTPVLRIDLDAFTANLAHIRAEVAPAEHMLVVKDDAYGHGLAPIIRRAWAASVRWFGAFDVHTGAVVRAQLGDDARIFVWLAGSDDEIRTAEALDFDLGVGDLDLLEDVARIASASSRRVRVHLKIDTGLHRNGIRPEQWDAAVSAAAAHQEAGSIEVVGLWTHLAEASDDEDDAAVTGFREAMIAAERAGLRPALRHVAASAASFARREFRHDLVRIGAFAYGIRPAGGPDHATLGIRPIATLAAPVIRIDDEGVHVAIGALHGLPSTLSGRVRVAGPAGPRTLLRVGALTSLIESWPEALIGDDVAVYGDGAASPTELAEAIGTIGEEIAVRVSPLVPREYRDG
ncbi:alanine racemase [Microbacterium deminutum]|uniref:Alanine racemase n=1 Tax=Microbacterium deminutum TaxID=344164 RepID=A0ABP5BS28_9MICO